MPNVSTTIHKHCESWPTNRKINGQQRWSTHTEHQIRKQVVNAARKLVSERDEVACEWNFVRVELGVKFSSRTRPWSKVARVQVCMKESERERENWKEKNAWKGCGRRRKPQNGWATVESNLVSEKETKQNFNAQSNQRHQSEWQASEKINTKLRFN